MCTINTSDRARYSGVRSRRRGEARPRITLNEYDVRFTLSY